MSNLTKPLYFESMDEVHQFAERVVDTIWEVERALAEVKKIDADEPVPFEPVDPVARAREIVEELIMIDAERDDIRRCYKRAAGRVALPLADAIRLTSLRKREQQIEKELQRLIGAEAALMTVFEGSEVVAKCHTYGVSWFYPTGCTDEYDDYARQALNGSVQ